MKSIITNITMYFVLSLTMALYAQNPIIDSRDGKTYSTIVIGNQTWMAENLNFDAGDGSADYDGKPENSKVYGLLYDWATAKDACPDNWHLPNDEEWDELVIFLGGSLSAGAKLKEEGTIHWKEPNKASNESGFTALPGGLRFDYGIYKNLTKVASFWTATKSTGQSAHYKKMRNSSENITSTDDLLVAGHSVRCIKD